MWLRCGGVGESGVIAAMSAKYWHCLDGKRRRRPSKGQERTRLSGLLRGGDERVNGEEELCDLWCTNYTDTFTNSIKHSTCAKSACLLPLLAPTHTEDLKGWDVGTSRPLQNEFTYQVVILIDSAQRCKPTVARHYVVHYSFVNNLTAEFFAIWICATVWLRRANRALQRYVWSWELITRDS